jgi:undecaprenyl pyrophosphate phosphatase UppP
MTLVSATPALRNLWAVTVMGGILLVDVAVTLWRSRALARGDYFELGLSAATIVVVWLVYRRQLLDLNRVAERIDDKAIARLSVGAFMMVIFVYGFVGQALKDMHH